jgi:hypothetical protein
MAWQISFCYIGHQTNIDEEQQMDIKQMQPIMYIYDDVKSHEDSRDIRRQRRNNLFFKVMNIVCLGLELKGRIFMVQTEA